MLASNPLVIEWHDLTDPKVLLGIDVVAHAASSQDLNYDSEGNPLSFMGIPLTRSLLCSSCGTAIGWSTDTYSCPSCGGRELGRFEANRDLGRQRMSRQQWDERHQETRRQLALAPGRRDDVEGLGKDDVDWEYFSESDSQSDEDGATRKTVRGTIQSAPRDRGLQSMAPFPAVNGSCMDVVSLQQLDEVCCVCTLVGNCAGSMCTDEYGSPSYQVMQNRPATTTADGPPTERMEQRLRSSMAEVRTALADVATATPSSRVESEAANYVPTGTQQFEFGYHNAAHIGKHRFAVEPLLNGEAFAATDAALADLPPNVAMHLDEQNLPVERRLKLDSMPTVVSDVLRLVKLANDRTVAEYEKALSESGRQLYERIQNGRARLHADQVWPIVDHHGVRCATIVDALRLHLPHAIGIEQADKKTVAVNFAVSQRSDCEPVSAATISLTTRDRDNGRMAVIVRNQHTCIHTIARVAEATAGRGLSPYGKGAYHIMLVDRLFSLRMQARWPLPLDVLQYIARGGKTDKPYLLNRIGEQRCRLLIEQMPASRLRYEQAVICRKIGDADDESGSDNEALPVEAGESLPSLVPNGNGSRRAAKALISYAYECYGLADQRGLSVMFRLAIQVGIDVTVPPLQEIFAHLTTPHIHGCSRPSLEARAPFHRSRAQAAARLDPWIEDLADLDDGTSTAGDSSSLQRWAHCKRVMRAMICAFGYHTSVGQTAFDMDREILTSESSTALDQPIHEAAAQDGATIGDALLSSDMAVVERAFKQLRAVSVRRTSRHQCALRANRTNSSQIAKMQLANQEDISVASMPTDPVSGRPQVPQDAVELAKWALDSNLLHVGELAVTRAIMYGLGAEGTVLNEPFDDAVASIGMGAGTLLAIRKLLRAARTTAASQTTDRRALWLQRRQFDEQQAWRSAIQQDVSPADCVREAQAWLGTDETWWLDGLASGGWCPICRQALDAVSPAKAALWKSVTQAALATEDPAWYVETDFCDLVHRVMEVTTKPKPFSLLRHHALPAWVIVNFNRTTTGLLRPTQVDLRVVVRQALGGLPSDTERHLVTPWKHAPYDRANAAFVMSATAEKAALKDFIATTGGDSIASLSSSVVKLRQRAVQLREMDSDETETAVTTSSDQVANASSAMSLRQHTDRFDDLLGITQIVVVQTAGADGGRFCADVPQSIQSSLEQQMAELPEDMLRVHAVSPRRPQAGIVSESTLRRLPRRTALASVMPGALTRCTAFCLVHWVTDMLTNVIDGVADKAKVTFTEPT